MAKFISLFSGVGGLDLGMEKAAHECVAQVEWDKNAAGVLKHRWPDVPLFCDVSKVRGEDLPECDFITYGFPCQDLSVAGKREGLSGKRSGLFYEATRIFREILDRGSVREDGSGRSGLRFALAENVPGLFSADDGQAFARCIRELLESGACEVGWRILNSEHFGVPQRRRRVFIVSDFGGESCDEILAVSESLPGYSAPKQKTRDNPAGNAQESIGADVYNGQLTGERAATLTSASGISNASGPKVMAIQGSMIGREDKNGPGGRGFKDDGTSFTLTSADKHGVAYEGEQIAFEPKSLDGPPRVTGNVNEVVCPSLNCMTGGGREPAVAHENLTVRRLTPIECERLQGFPDNWTSEKMELILEGNEWKATGKVVKQADGPRYRQMGNAVSVPVAEWIGKQIAKVL